MNKFEIWWFLNKPWNRRNFPVITLCVFRIHKTRVRKFAGRNQKVCERCGMRN